MPLSKDQILSAEDRETRTVSVHEWGGEVLLRTMTGTDRNAYEQSLIRVHGNQAVPNMANASAKLLARCIVGEDGERLFTEAEIVELGKKSAAVLNRLADVAAEMNGLTDEAVEDLAGNSEAAPSGAFTSA